MIKIGTMIGDRYEVLERIGMGGMSDVYKAKDHKLNRHVAVKVLKQEFSENTNFVSKFRVEAQAAASLMHPNIVNVYDVGEDNGVYYIVMELVDGITLKKYIEKKARLSVREALSIAIQACMGIEAAHNNHIIHRDIKPQNIIISKDGKVQTLTSRCGTGGGNVPLVLDGVENSGEGVENLPAVTLKIRSGCEGGGKGAIWQEDKSATLGCNNDQTVFVPKCYGVCSKASHSMMSDNPHSGFYEAETSRTLDRSGGDPTCNQGGICVVETVAFTQNQRDEVRDLGETAGSLSAQPGMKQQTFVAQPDDVTAFHVNQRNELIDLHGKSGALMATRSDQMLTFVLQGNMIGRKDENGPQGDGINEDVCFTLDATDRHAVCAPEDVYAMTTGSFMRIEENVSPTLMARDFKDPTTIAPVPHLNDGVSGTVATGAHPSGFNGQDAFNDRLVIDNPAAQPAPVSYTVRRLTPTECARLQGFPDWWCHDLATENPTEEELAFWQDAFETHRRLVTHAKKPKTEKQIRKWLADPYSDAAEYKLWGNGVALPCVFFVLSGIAWAAGLPVNGSESE